VLAVPVRIRATSRRLSTRWAYCPRSQRCLPPRGAASIVQATVSREHDGRRGMIAAQNYRPGWSDKVGWRRRGRVLRHERPPGRREYRRRTGRRARQHRKTGVSGGVTSGRARTAAKPGRHPAARRLRVARRGVARRGRRGRVRDMSTPGCARLSHRRVGTRRRGESGRAAQHSKPSRRAGATKRVGATNGGWCRRQRVPRR
jgi:hypothetical protein